MKGFIGLTKRNLLLYFKDIQAVFFSLLTPILVLGLYLLFLKGTFVGNIDYALRGLENFVKAGDIDALANGLLLSGVIGSALITVPYNCMTTVVLDRETQIDFDIASTPMKRGAIISAYFVSAVISSFVMTGIIFTAGLVIMSTGGNVCFTATRILYLYGMLFLGAVSATAIFMVVVLFFKSTSASSAFFGLLSAAAGFVIGAYIPISQFSENIQTFCNIFPASHVTILLRKNLLIDVVDKMSAEFNGLDGGMFKKTMETGFSFNANMFGNIVSSSFSVVYIGIFTVVAVAALIVLYGKTYRRK